MSDIYCNGCQNPKVQCLCDNKIEKLFMFGKPYKEEKLYTELQVEQISNERCRDLQAKVLQWYASHNKDEEFAVFFGIQSSREGKIT